MKGMKKIYVTILIIAIPIQIFAWTIPINISRTQQRSNEPAIAIDRWGRIHVVWEDFQTHPVVVRGDILYRQKDGIFWGEIINISHDSLTEAWTPRIAVDTFGCAHVVWEEFVYGTRNKIYYSFFDGKSWSAPISLSDSLLQGNSKAKWADIAIDQKNRIHLVWQDAITGYTEVYYAMYDGDHWSTPLNLSNNPNGAVIPKIAIDGQNHLHVVWCNYGDFWELDSVEIYYSKFDGDSWTTPVNISRSPKQSYYPNIAIGPDDNPHVVWEERKRGYRIYYSFYDGSSWSTPHSLDSLTGESGYLPDLVVDQQNNVHIVWGGESPALWYVFYNGMSWSSPCDLSIAASVNALIPDITVDHTNCLHLVWTELTDYIHDISDIYYSKQQLTGIEEYQGPSLTYSALSFLSNPFTKTTTVKFTLSYETKVSLRIYDTSGRIVSALINDGREAGHHTITWDVGDLPSGIYFARLDTDNFTCTRKLILIR